MASLTLSDDLNEQIMRIAAKNKCSPEDVIRQLLENDNNSPPAAIGNRYLALLENAFDFVALHEPNGERIYISPAFEQILGYTVDELQALPPGELVHPDDLPYTRDDAHQRALRGETIANVQYRLRHQDGHYIWIETTTIPILDADGGVRQLLAASREISALKQAEEALVEKEHFLRTVFSSAQSSIFVIGVDENGEFRLIDNNRANKQSLGLSDDVPLNVPFEDIPGLSPDLAAHFQSNYQRCVDAGTTITYKEKLTVNDHTTWWTTQLTPLKNGDKRVHRILGFSLDTTPQHEALLALQASEKRFRSLIEMLPDAIVIFDADGIVCMTNPAHAAINGYDDANDMIGSSIFDFTDPADVARMQADIQTVIASGEPLKAVEYTVLRRDGTPYPAEISMAALPSRGMLMAVIRDITRRKRAEQQAFELALEKERGRILANFLQDTAHEFRTPITIIETSLYLMERKPDKATFYANRIRDQLNRLLRLVDELRLMTDLDTGYQWTLEPLDLYTLLNEVSRRFQQYASEKGQTLETHLAPDLPPVRGEAEKLIQAIEEVLRNAVQYTPANGEITLRAAEHNEQVIITITDTGDGMAEDVLARAFERFSRADTAHTSAGFGLGLPTAQIIIEAHDGKITLESTPGKGTTAYITLPLSASTTA